MNVLVYSDVGTQKDWLAQSHAALKGFLGPSYDVMPVYARQLAEDPWESTTALLVFPGGRDLPYCAALNGQPNARIKAYVEGGGRYLGICAGAYYASGRVEFEIGTPLEVVGDRELGFFPGVCKGGVWPGFQYDSEDGARTANVSLDTELWRTAGEWQDAPETTEVYWNGGGMFSLMDTAEANSQCRVVGRYADIPGQPPAGLLCDVAQGKALLWSVHPEHVDLPNKSSPSDLALLRSSLQLLGLRPAEAIDSPPRPQPQLIISSRHELKDAFEQTLLAVSDDGVLKDITDCFRLAHSASEIRNGEKGILLQLESHQDAAGFSFSRYLSSLPAGSEYGHLLLYSPVVSSTQTMLDKNPRFLGACPNGLVSVALHQVSGRGRGSNTWVSPEGCLCLSLVVRAPPRLASGIVFAQYLFAMAVADGLEELLEGHDIGVRLKWPNDIYADLGHKLPTKDRFKKLGGILVNTSYAGNDFTLVIGCGLNVLNKRPTLALCDLVPASLRHRISLESVLAAIVPAFERLWTAFLSSSGSFLPFSQRYTSIWIHSGQEITIAATKQVVRIVGITPDHGLLRTVPADGSPGYIDLQPDGNSFDMLHGCKCAL